MCQSEMSEEAESQPVYLTSCHGLIYSSGGHRKGRFQRTCYGLCNAGAENWLVVARIAAAPFTFNNILVHLITEGEGR